MKLLMENFKKFLNEAKEEATREEIKAVVHKVLEDEGGAAGLDPIKKELEKLELPEGSMDELILSVDGVKKHDKGDYILTIGLEEGELEEGAKPDFLDLDGDGNKKESMKKAAADKKKAKAQKKK